MEDSKKISSAVIRRLPRYYRYLGELIESGVQRISSKDLSTKMKVTGLLGQESLNINGLNSVHSQRLLSVENTVLNGSLAMNHTIQSMMKRMVPYMQNIRN